VNRPSANLRNGIKIIQSTHEVVQTKW